jgi:hypothetical protein
VLDVDRLAGLLGTRTAPVPVSVVRGSVSLTWHARPQPMPPGSVDLGLGVPLMDGTRIQRELGWNASRTAAAALLELLDGLRRGAGVETPPLAPSGAAAAAGRRS